MITLRKYQEEAVQGLLKDTYSLLAKPGARHKMVFKGITGKSFKRVIGQAIIIKDKISYSLWLVTTKFTIFHMLNEK